MSQMSPPPPPPPPPPPHAHVPPTIPGQISAPLRPTRWPGVIGTIAIVLGVLGAICGVFGIFGPMINEAMSSALPRGAVPGVEAQKAWAGWLMAGAAVGVLISIVEIVGGVGLVQRQSWGVRAISAWAWLSIAYAFANTLLQYQMGNATLSEVAASPAASAPTGISPAGMQTMVRGGMLIGLCMSLVWTCAFPVFVLIWLRRYPIRQETQKWAGVPSM